MRRTERLLVTGGAGFIGSSFLRYLFRQSDFHGKIVNLDKLTYAADLSLLKGLDEHPRYKFVQGDINNRQLVESLLEDEEIDAIVHFAAESHVDRSIVSSDIFFETNVRGTLTLLEAVRKFPHVHFHFVSTDEVYGSLGESGVFDERSPLRPNSPYAASKASADHLVRAYTCTYHLSTTISHCSNNYGPGQHPEKFIPHMITRALKRQTLPVYGRGSNVRDWLYVDDHAEGVWRIVQRGKQGEIYDMGGGTEISNLDLLNHLLKLFAEETKTDVNELYTLIRFVEDRPGHDFRYAIDASKIKKHLGWESATGFDAGLRRTIRWYTQMNSKVDFLLR